MVTQGTISVMLMPTTGPGMCGVLERVERECQTLSPGTLTPSYCSHLTAHGKLC